MKSNSISTDTANRRAATLVASVVNSEAPADYRVQVRIKPEGSARAKTSELTDDQIVELAREILRERNRYRRDDSDAFTSPAVVRDFLNNHFFGVEREEFAVMLLDSQHRIMHLETLFQGTINAAPVYPREVLKLVLRHNAAAVILAHNHPSGVAEPSQADIRITERVQRALSMIDVNLLDHFVVGDPNIVSFAERGLI